MGKEEFDARIKSIEEMKAKFDSFEKELFDNEAKKDEYETRVNNFRRINNLFKNLAVFIFIVQILIAIADGYDTFFNEGVYKYYIDTFRASAIIGLIVLVLGLLYTQKRSHELIDEQKERNITYFNSQVEVINKMHDFVVEYYSDAIDAKHHVQIMKLVDDSLDVIVRQKAITESN